MAFTKLLQELEYVPDNEVAYITREPTGAYDRLQKSIVRGEFARMSADIVEKAKASAARPPGIKAAATTFKANIGCHAQVDSGRDRRGHRGNAQGSGHL